MLGRGVEDVEPDVPIIDMEQNRMLARWKAAQARHLELYDPGHDSGHNGYPDNSQALGAALDAIFTPSRIANWRGLVIDDRFNTGGDDALGLQLAARLTNTAYLAYTKQARDDPTNPHHYGPAHQVNLTPAEARRYTGPIWLLTSDLTVSAGETFAEALLARTPAPTRIGTPTQGVFSDDMHRHLPNGWSFTLGNEAYLAPDGHNYEGAGIPPTIPTPVFTPADLNQHTDTALQTALNSPWPHTPSRPTRHRVR